MPKLPSPSRRALVSSGSNGIRLFLRKASWTEPKERAKEFVAEAKNILSTLSLADNQRAALNLVADGVVERYS